VSLPFPRGERTASIIQASRSIGSPLAAGAGFQPPVVYELNLMTRHVVSNH